MSAQALAVTLLGLLTVACGGPRIEPHPAAVLSPAITERGEAVYVGHVFPRDEASTVPTYVYERRVDEHDGVLVSTHVTREPAGAIQLAESATHSSDYALADYTLHANQLGQRGSIHVDHDEVTFRVTDADGERTAVEHAKDPVVVGPTLVGYMLRRLDALQRGEVVDVRLAVLERLETIGFQLAAVPVAPGQTRVRMSPSSFLVGLAVEPIDFTFDTATRKLVRLEGRVPTKVRDGKHWSDFDARVEYDFVASSYR